MSGQQKNPLLQSNYSVKLDTKSSLLSTSTAIISNPPKTQEKGSAKGPHVTHRLSRELSNKPKTVSTPSVKLLGTTPKLSDKYAISTNLNEKTTAGKISAQTKARPKIETLSKSAKPVALKSTNLQTKSLLLSATKSGLLTKKKPTTPPLTLSLKSSPRPSPHLSTTSSKDIGKYSTSLLSSSHSAPSAVTSLKSSHIKATQPVGKTTHSLVKSRSDAPAKQKHSHRQGAAGRDDTDDAAAPHYDLKLETTRSEKEDEAETFVPPELDPSINEPPLPTINVVQVRTQYYKHWNFWGGLSTAKFITKYVVKNLRNFRLTCCSTSQFPMFSLLTYKFVLTYLSLHLHR